MLLDEQAFACGCSCTIDGPCHVTSSDDGTTRLPQPAAGSSDCSRSTSSAAAAEGLGPLRSRCRPVKVSRPAAQSAAARASSRGTTGSALFSPGMEVVAAASPFGSSLTAGATAMSEEDWDTSCSRLVDATMCVKGAVAAALLVSTGAFAEEEARLY